MPLSSSWSLLPRPLFTPRRPGQQRHAAIVVFFFPPCLTLSRIHLQPTSWSSAMKSHSKKLQMRKCLILTRVILSVSHETPWPKTRSAIDSHESCPSTLRVHSLWRYSPTTLAPNTGCISNGCTIFGDLKRRWRISDSIRFTSWSLLGYDVRKTCDVEKKRRRRIPFNDEQRTVLIFMLITEARRRSRSSIRDVTTRDDRNSFDVMLKMPVYYTITVNFWIFNNYQSK